MAVVCHHGSRCAPPPFAGDIASTFFHAPPSLASRRGFGSTHGGFGLSRGGGALRGVSPASARSDGEPSARRMSSASHLRLGRRHGGHARLRADRRGSRRPRASPRPRPRVGCGRSTPRIRGWTWRTDARIRAEISVWLNDRSGTRTRANPTGATRTPGRARRGARRAAARGRAATDGTDGRRPTRGVRAVCGRERRGARRSSERAHHDERTNTALSRSSLVFSSTRHSNVI